MKLRFVATLFVCLIISSALITPSAHAIVEEGLRLMEGVTLGHGFTRVDESEGIKLWDTITVRPFIHVQEQYDSNVSGGALPPGVCAARVAAQRTPANHRDYLAAPVPPPAGAGAMAGLCCGRHEVAP